MPRIALAATVLFASLLSAQQPTQMPGQMPVQMPVQMPLRGQLPAIGTVGDAPTTDTLTIEVHDDGTLTVGGLPLSYDELVVKVHDMAAALPGEPVGAWKPSRLNVLIRAAEALPLAAVTQVVRTCVGKDTAAPRVFFGARHASDGHEGAFAWFLPMDDIGQKGVEPGSDHDELRVLLRGDIDGQPTGLCSKLASTAKGLDDAKRQRTWVLVDAPGDARWATVLSVFDAAARAGLGGTDLQSDLTPTQHASWDAAGSRHDLRALVAAAPAIERVGCRIGPATVFDAIAPDAPQRASGRFAGFATLRLTTFAPPAEAEEVTEEVVVSAGVGKASVDGPAAAAIADGLRWLCIHQDEDGRWDCDQFMKHDHAQEICDGPGEKDHDVGVTGLALLALLADGNTMRTGPYKDNVKRAVGWLRNNQQQNGLIGPNSSHDYIYGHAIATLALAEAYGLSGSKLLQPTVQNAINYLETHRNPYAVWRYQPRDNDNDTAVTSWCLHAYSAARDFDLQVNKQAFQIAEGWLDEITDPATGHHGYTKRGEPSSRQAGDHAQRFPVTKNEALTGTGLFLRALLGQSPKSPVCKMAADLVVTKLPEWTPGEGNIDFYAWYWCSLGLYQVGGEHWKKWQPAVTNALLAGQNKRGVAAGSWDPIGVWGDEGGRVYSTAMATMTLQTSYRFARLQR
ncbi:MAG: hypothetical protein H6835_02670 [Planctomycetes bacterium]|nr:hypothetical protein [Planctomycetota bacterium]